MTPSQGQEVFKKNSQLYGEKKAKKGIHNLRPEKQLGFFEYSFTYQLRLLALVQAEQNEQIQKLFDVYKQWGEANRKAMPASLTNSLDFVNEQVEFAAKFPIFGGVGVPGRMPPGARILRPNQYNFAGFQVGNVVRSSTAIRRIIGNALKATGTHKTQWTGLFSFIRRNGGAGFQGLTRNPLSRPNVVIANFRTSHGNVIARIDLNRIPQNRVFDLQNATVRQEFLSRYPQMRRVYDQLASEGVVAIRGDIPAEAVTAIIRLRSNASNASIRALLQLLLE